MNNKKLIVFLAKMQANVKTTLATEICWLQTELETAELFKLTNAIGPPVLRSIMYEELTSNETVLANLHNIFINEKGEIMLPKVLDGWGKNKHLNLYIDYVIKLHVLTTGVRYSSVSFITYYRKKTLDK